jgi:hypothetical protein
MEQNMEGNDVYRQLISNIRGCIAGVESYLGAQATVKGIAAALRVESKAQYDNGNYTRADAYDKAAESLDRSTIEQKHA